MRSIANTALVTQAVSLRMAETAPDRRTPGEPLGTPVVGDVRIDLLGRFRVVVGECEVAEDAWATRRSRELVALLALSNGHRLARDQAIEHLWPHLDAGAGAANLRKAAHHARRALRDRRAVVLHGERVELFPNRVVDVDAQRFLAAAEEALRDADPVSCANIAAAFAGELLPDSPYETWTQEPRRQLHARLCELLRAGGRWERLFDLEPTDEEACRELMRHALDAGRRRVAIGAYQRLRIALLRELGIQPEVDTRALHEQCMTGVLASEPACVRRKEEPITEARQPLERLSSQSRAIPTQLPSPAPPLPAPKRPPIRHQLVAAVPRALAVTITGTPTTVRVTGLQARYDQNLRIRQRSVA